ncbi:MAG TPA: anthranilate phosphoribosyltransferase [Chloroflexota bacterium]|nr:anthranilate phosphoribosyltransferase [Chloroflexota bacterium]
MIREAIGKVTVGENLTRDEAAAVMEEIFTGVATPAQFGALVTALRIKGETVDEIAGFASVMRRLARQVVIDRPVVDTCGTGGDNRNTFNISTTAAFVAAGAGATVAKHGNRSATSQCGSADVLEALGVNISLAPEQVRTCLEEAGIGFMYAQLYHPAMKFAGGPRKEIGIRTVFNILGPLTNPAGARAQVLGVPTADLVERMAAVLALLGSHHALVVHGEDGMDEISLCAPTLVGEVRDGEVRTYRVAPEEYGLDRAEPAALRGGDATTNAALLRGVLEGQNGARRAVVLLNAAAALVAADHADGLSDGIRLAAHSIDSGAALARLEKLVQVSQAPMERGHGGEATP